MTGRTCGHLAVVSRMASDKTGKVSWLCRCSCGNEAVVAGVKLRSGHTRSCGCMHRPALDRFAEKIALTDPEHLEPVTPRENVLRGIAPAALHAKKTHCPAGHEYAGDNLYVHPTKGLRYCRACGRAHAQRKRDIQKAS